MNEETEMEKEPTAEIKEVTAPTPEAQSTLESIEIAPPAIDATVRLGDIFQANAALGRLMSKELPFRVSYQLGKFARKFDKEIKIIEAARNNLIVKHGEEKDNGHSVSQDKMGEFMNDFGEVLATPSLMEAGPVKLNMAELDGLIITPTDLLALEKFIIIDEGTKTGDTPAK